LPLIRGFLASKGGLPAHISTLLLRLSDCGRYLVIVSLSAPLAAAGDAGESENVSQTFGLFGQLSLSNSPQTFRLRYPRIFPAGKRHGRFAGSDSKGHKISAQLWIVNTDCNLPCLYPPLLLQQHGCLWSKGGVRSARLFWSLLGPAAGLTNAHTRWRQRGYAGSGREAALQAVPAR
jgi:hypothetical protein